MFVVLIALALTGHLNDPGTHALLALTNGVGAISTPRCCTSGLVRKQRPAAGCAACGCMIVQIVAAPAR